MEFFGGLAIVLGIETRYAAALMIAFVIVATLISHRFWECKTPPGKCSDEVLQEHGDHRRLRAAIRCGRRALRGRAALAPRVTAFAEVSEARLAPPQAARTVARNFATSILS